MARYSQITVGQLETYLSLIKDKNINVCVGFGENTRPLCFLINCSGKLLLHPGVYQGDQSDNIREVLSLNITKEHGNKNQ